MREPGQRLGDGPVGEPLTDPAGFGRVRAQPVRRTDLQRSRQAAFCPEVHPEAALFASRLARAVGQTPANRSPADDPPGVHPALRDAVFGDGPLIDDRTAGRRSEPIRNGKGRSATGPAVAVPDGPDAVRLPTAPAMVCDHSDRIVRANAALLRLAAAPATGMADPDLLGMRMEQLVIGPDSDARLVRSDGSQVHVRVVRWGVGGGLFTVILVELGAVADSWVSDSQVAEPRDGAGRVDRALECLPAELRDGAGRVDRAWAAELERLAGVGTWSFELATGTLQRSETLEELYRSVGLSEWAGDGMIENRPVEREQVALLCAGLRAGDVGVDDHAEIQLPDERRLSCRAEMETAADGTPVRVIGVVRDLTSGRIAEDQVRYSGRRFADLMALVPVGVALLDESGRIVEANTGLCALLDAAPEQLCGASVAVLDAELPLGTEAAPAPELPGWLRRIPPGAKYGYRVGAAALRRGDGTSVWCELAVSGTSADDGAWFWLVVCTDISEQRRAAELLRSAGTVDELTRLLNRTAGLELVDRLLVGAGRDRVAVVCGDLDDFARVNSSLGHEMGDELLVTLAGRLQRELPFGCTAARLSGDEFVVICADHAEVGGPDRLARIVADLLRTTVTVRGQPVQLTASVGLAIPEPSGDVRAADLLRFAEAAMHEVKRTQSRGGIGMATDGVVSTATGALELEAELKAAIAGAGLVLDYQPVVGSDGTVRSAEALVRWPHPERGLIAPNDFLPMARRSGLLRDLDLWVLRTAVREAATWPEHQGSRPAVAVNLAGLLPGDPDFMAVVTDAVQAAGLPWHSLVLELVETTLVALPPCALAAMAELVQRGVRFAVDDFGTGYSSLARLKELPAQTIKIDRAFVTGIAEDPADFAVARAVVDMARAMGRTTVAEGVETAEQFHVLRGIGVDAFQGWLFARPLPPRALRAVLAGGPLDTPASTLA